jgi:predicted transcriptional regulator
MDMIPLKTERKAPLEESAKRRGQDPPAALDNALAAYLEWEGQDFAEAAEGIRRGHEDMSDGKTRPAGEFLADLRPEA